MLKQRGYLMLLTILMVVSFFSMATAQTIEGSHRFCSELTFCSMDCLDHITKDLTADCSETCDCNLKIQKEHDEEIGPMAIPCNCGGTIVTRFIGSSIWRYVDAYMCGTHMNCAVKVYVKDHYYENFCSSCGFYSPTTQQETRLDHTY